MSEGEARTAGNRPLESEGSVSTTARRHEPELTVGQCVMGQMGQKFGWVTGQYTILLDRLIVRNLDLHFITEKVVGFGHKN